MRLKESFLSLSALLAGVLLVFLLSFTSASASVFIENFDSYSTGDILTVSGGVWLNHSSGGSCNFLVTISESLSLPNSLSGCAGSSLNFRRIYAPLATTTTQNFQFSFDYRVGTNNMQVRLSEGYNDDLARFDFSSGNISVVAFDGALSSGNISSTTIGTYYNVLLRAETVPLSTSTLVSIFINDDLRYQQTVDNSSMLPTDIFLIKTGNSASDSRVDNIFFYSDSDLPPIPDFSSGTRVLSLVPLNRSLTSSTTVALSVSYVSNFPVPSEICIGLNDLTWQQSTSAFCQPVTQTGSNLSFSTSTLLRASHTYQIWGFLRDENNEIIHTTINNFQSFDVFSRPQSIYDPEQGWGVNPNPVTGTSTVVLCEAIDSGIPRAFCDLASFLFVPSPGAQNTLNIAYENLDSKIPFSVVSEFSDAFFALDRRPTVSPTVLTVVVFGQNVELLGSTSSSAIIPSNTLDLFRYLIAVGLWVSFAWWGFTRVRKLI